ncbi:hypothetical protein Goshw_017565 [Gossypium schwendimanii]|uniref:Uncharacterized protein n=1 Tax=Gossypium schwendimanii TaxID=34291 RepID=A0A7J9MIM8_GOSSC|nr:hypothetical protein [Gossypium schwendimanii]
MTYLMEKTIVTLVRISIGSLLVIKKPINLDITVSLIMTNLLLFTTKIEPLGNMLK